MKQRRNYWFWMRVLAMFCAAVMILSLPFTTKAQAESKLPGGNSGKITVIDYGNAGMNADAVLVESNGKYILMDTGYTDNKNNLGNSSVIKTLKSMGVRRLDLYLSHWHNDHYFLMITIMKDPYFTVGTVYLPYSQRLLDLSASKNKDCKWYKDLTKNIKRSGKSWGPNSYTAVMDTLKKKGIKAVTLRKGSTFSVGDAKFQVLWQKTSFSTPSKRTRHLNQVINNTSLVTRVTIGGVRYLTAGDIHKSVERDMMRSGVDLKADIFKTSHHSNKDTSNCTEMFKAVDAAWAFGTGSGSSTCRKGTEKSRTNYINVKDNGQITFNIKNGVISVSAKKKLREVSKAYKLNGEKYMKNFYFDSSNKYFFKKTMFPKGSSF